MPARSVRQRREREVVASGELRDASSERMKSREWMHFVWCFSSVSPLAARRFYFEPLAHASRWHGSLDRLPSPAVNL